MTRPPSGSSIRTNGQPLCRRQAFLGDVAGRAAMKPPSLLLLTMAAGGCFSMAPAEAQLYPTKPVRVITANSPGGTSDIFVRALGDELQKRWGQPVIIENRSGGGMNIAGRACADAANDGRSEERRVGKEGRS